MIDLAICVLCDFVPIMFLLIFHFKNFSGKKEEIEVTEEGENQYLRAKSVEGAYADLSLPVAAESETLSPGAHLESAVSLNPLDDDDDLASEESFKGLLGSDAA